MPEQVIFWSPERVFLTCRISRSGLHFVVFTNDQSLEGVEPIVQKDNGGKLWGRIKLKHVVDLDKVIKPVIESHKRLDTAVKDGRATGWWAMVGKDKKAS